MILFRTNAVEKELFLRLVYRGRWADREYYFSVESHDWENGVVIFTRLDCAPAPSFKVGVAGNCLVVSETYRSEVRSWLLGWGIGFEQEERDVSSPDEARGLLAQLRESTASPQERKTVGVEVREAIIRFNQSVDRDLRLFGS